ncbi:hypothetical protein PSH66_05000 [Pseudomonas sp. FP597]|uniref:hypothetical protein n=1 Tax=Pseudomonas sp. FP597 TaxID=2954096 RepID=UPI0027334AB3|nr:hypothetical protein [Pseudomonas sp. FP597]WLI07691.1 hypothetical protein PSH66_05000 [Pseudomonas sp. FP597]
MEYSKPTLDGIKPTGEPPVYELDFKDLPGLTLTLPDNPVSVRAVLLETDPEDTRDLDSKEYFEAHAGNAIEIPRIVSFTTAPDDETQQRLPGKTAWLAYEVQTYGGQTILSKKVEVRFKG